MTTNGVKRLHGFTRATTDEMKTQISDSIPLTNELQEACDTAHDACDICTSTRRPVARKQIYMSHANKECNHTVTAECVTTYIRGEKYEGLNIIDAGANFCERTLLSKWDAASLSVVSETECIYHHGAPTYFTADPEFTKPILVRFLRIHDISLHVKPFRSLSKNKKIKRKNGLVRLVLDRISRESTDAAPNVLVGKTPFLANSFHGSCVLSAFRLAWGYSPSML